MPVTLPAHAAAVLPLLRFFRRAGVSTGLVVGACAPDLAYVHGLRRWSEFAHEPPGFLLFCLPVGLAVYLWLQALVFPVLRRALPEVGGVQGGRFVPVPGLPRSPGAWGALVLALALGAATHVLWDGFTHRAQWPARVLYPEVRVPVAGRELPLARVLQHASSLGGSGVVLVWLARRYRHLAPVPGGSRADALRVLVPTGVGAGVGLGLRLLRFEDMGALEAQLWWSFWPGVTGALLGFTLGCLRVRWLTARRDSV